MGLLAASMFAVCILRSRGRLLWADELIGARVLDSSTWMATVHGWYQGADGGGLFFYLLGRLWLTLFGHTDLALRLFSTAGMAAALALTWVMLRRRFSIVAVAIAVGVVFFTPPVMLWQELNGRFYGLFLAAAALANLLFVLTAEETSTPLLLSLTACAHALLIGSHLLGLVYSFCLIAAAIALDLTRRQFRPRLYLAAAAGWVMVPVSFHAIRASASIATTSFWTQKPTLALLPFGAILFARPLLYASVLLAIVTAALLLSRRRTFRLLATLTPEHFLVAALVLAELILFLKSQTGISIFSDRYLLPLSLADATLLAAWLSWALPPSFTTPRSTPTGTALLALMLVACLAYAGSRRVNYRLYADRSYPDQIARSIPPGAPVIGTTSPFLLLSRYDPTHNYLFMTDWAFDNDPKRAATDYSGERLMENWHRAGYQPGHILPCTVLFSRYNDVYVLLDFHRADWFQEHLLHNPEFQVQHLGRVADWWFVDIWAVHRIQQGPPPC